MEKYVITISRQFASMGRTIAQKMSQELGIEFYDRYLVEQAAKRMHQPVSDISAAEERGGLPFASRRYPLGMEMLSIQREIFDVQSNIIRDLAEKESCIIVGRCADSILKNMDRHLNIYVYAPYKQRIRNCIEELGMNEQTAVRMIREVDKAREQYRRRYSEGRSTIFDYRELMIDSSRFGTDKTAHILCNIARDLFE